MQKLENLMIALFKSPSLQKNINVFYSSLNILDEFMDSWGESMSQYYKAYDLYNTTSM